MPDRLSNKITETREIAAANGIDLAGAPLLVTFEQPIWGAGIGTHELTELARIPGTVVAATSPEPLPEVRRAASHSPNLQLIAERGLVIGLSGGATRHVYPYSRLEAEAFACALFAGVAPTGLRVALSGYVSSGRQQVAFESAAHGPLTALELIHQIRHLGGTASPASEEEGVAVVADEPAELEVLRSVLAGPLAGHPVSVVRLPSGRFRITPDQSPRGPADRARIQVVAREIAVSCDRFVEVRGDNTFGFVTEPVARWEYGTERGARLLAEELFGRPDTVLTHLGLHPFGGDQTLFFAYEGSETVWEAANKGISYIPVRDVLEYARILHAIREGDA
ncbi:MAG: hypothetical protein ACYTGN_08665 [Planctomycetota bacterium]|jgi:hypothetical protein